MRFLLSVHNFSRYFPIHSMSSLDMIINNDGGDKLHEKLLFYSAGGEKSVFLLSLIVAMKKVDFLQFEHGQCKE